MLIDPRGPTRVGNEAGDDLFQYGSLGPLAIGINGGTSGNRVARFRGLTGPMRRAARGVRGQGRACGAFDQDCHRFSSGPSLEGSIDAPARTVAHLLASGFSHAKAASACFLRVVCDKAVVGASSG